MAKQKFYVVWKGKKTGIFTSWTDCKKQIDGFTGALYKSFEDRLSAEKAFKSKPGLYIGNGSSKTKLPKANVGKPVWESISVDAACSGNPGALEYRGVRTKNAKQLFHLGPFPEGTVNLGEFLAIVHGLAYLKKLNSNLPIYSDSKTAMKWVRDKKINTKLERSKKNEKLFELVNRGVEWLKNNQYSNQILKWETSSWGEIPADFGRK